MTLQQLKSTDADFQGFGLQCLEELKSLVSKQPNQELRLNIGNDTAFALVNDGTECGRVAEVEVTTIFIDEETNDLGLVSDNGYDESTHWYFDVLYGCAVWPDLLKYAMITLKMD